MGMLESTHGEQVCKYNHVIGLYTMLKISGIKNFNTPVSKYPNIRTFCYVIVMLYECSVIHTFRSNVYNTD